MNPLKDAFLFCSRQSVLRKLLSTSGPCKIISKRFVSGETLSAGIKASRELSHHGIMTTLDQLGESICKAEEATLSVQEYFEILDQLQKENLGITISLKLTQLGLDIDYALCLDNMRRIMRKVQEVKSLVTIDMEGSPHTDRTLNIYQTLLKEGFKSTGIVVQSYLYRTEADIRNMLSLGPRVRLCKGAYQEPPEVAFPLKKDVDHNYLRILGILLAEESLTQGAYPEIATHDEKIIKWTIDFVRKKRIDHSKFEFQMLYGIRRDLQGKLVRDGYRLRVYVPYGTHWYPYFMRRLAERPANLIFICKSLLHR